MFSVQGWTYMIITIISYIISLIIIGINLGLLPTFLLLILFIIMSLFNMIYAYTISCLTKGDCYIWSWIITILSLIPTIMYIAVVIIGVITMNKEQTNQTEIIIENDI